MRSAAEPLWLRVDPVAPEVEPIADAASAVAAGRVVAYPTETFYGLAADPRNADALDDVLRLKGRGPEKPLLLLISSLDMLESLAADVAPTVERVARELWPGPLTILLPAAAGLHAALTGPRGTVAVRRSAHPVAAALVAACGVPLTAPSANPTGLPPACDAARVVEYFGSGIGVVVDGGPTPGGLPSTLLDLTSVPARILRPGAMSADRIAEIVRLI